MSESDAMMPSLEEFELLISRETIQEKVRDLGARIAEDYEGKDLVLIGVLKGCTLFMSDLMRAIEVDLTCDFLRVSSYDGGLKSSGIVRWEFDITQPIKDKHVLLVEDIIDTGLTIRFLLDNLQLRLPASLKVCTLLHKPDRTVADIQVDYLGFSIPNRFVIGYGLDLEGKYRNLPDILALRNQPED